MQKFTQERLKELLHYAPETGVFTWRSPPIGGRPRKQNPGLKNYVFYRVERPHKDSTTGLLGVSVHKSTGRYRAVITMNREYISLGLYETPELAHAAYRTAKRQLHGEECL